MLRERLTAEMKEAMKAGQKQKLSTVRMIQAGLKDEQGGRPELAENERAEAAIIQAFLPQQMDEADTRAAIRDAIAETGAASPKDMGKVIGVRRGKFAGRMDFSKASGLVKEALAGA